MLQTAPEYIAQKIPSVFFRFSQEFGDAGFQAVLVGGAIRDIVLGDEPGDFDFATDAEPEQVMQLFPSVIPTGIQHGTVTVRFHKHSIEVTTYRVDGEYSDRRRPDSVSFTRSLADDLQRRDFTINALAIALPDCQVIDETGGLQDLDSRTIRAIGTPQQRFREDALRIWRALRFSARLGFNIEPATAAAMQEEAAGVRAIAAERIRDEWIKLLSGSYAGEAVLYAAQIRILDTVVPDILTDTDVLRPVCQGFETAPNPAAENPGALWEWRFATLLAIAVQKDQKRVNELHRFLNERRYSRRDVSVLLHTLRAILADVPETADIVPARRYLHCLQKADYLLVQHYRRLLGLPTASRKMCELLHTESDRGIAYSPADLAVNGTELARILDRPPAPGSAGVFPACCSGLWIVRRTTHPGPCWHMPANGQAASDTPPIDVIMTTILIW